MKRFFLLLFFNCAFFIVHCTFSQNLLVKMWDKRFGGTLGDAFCSFQQTTDGGYILGGSSESDSGGDKTQDIIGGVDYWIVKIDSLGNIEWDKNFGGTDYDELQSLQQTADGGYILGGYSFSGISGDKTQSSWGNADYWIVKTDSLGSKQWDKDFGGIDYDELISLQQTADRGYILGGYSYSDISGDKTEPTWGGAGDIDYWIVKIDSLGDKQWDKDFGGTGNDAIFSLLQTADGGYILGGSSFSGISGDKTQTGWGTSDYWIVKTDSLGNKLWDKDFGGTNYDELLSLQQTADSGYILGGYSLSSISGNKTEPVWGNYDYWIVKTDFLGNMQWDKDFGGTNSEELWSITQSTDGGYLISGYSYSPISGDKAENNLGQEQTWVVKTDSAGNKQWDKTIFTSGHDERGRAIQTRDGCYVIANWTNGGIGGYKTQVAWSNSLDYWIIKFCDSTILQPLFAAPPFLCPGTCTNFANLSFNATSYQWNFPGATPDTSTSVNPTNICYANPGSYDVQLIATNANGSDTLTLANYITVYPSPPTQSITQNGDTLFANSGATTYQWYFNGNIISGATNYFYVAPASGDYNVVCTDLNGCEVEAAIFNVTAGLTPPDSYRDLSKGEGVTVFPNPVGDQLRIQDSVPIDIGITMGMAPQGVLRTVEISVYNMLGEDIHCEVDRRQLTVDCRLLPSGMYWLEMCDGKRTFHSKFVKQ